MEKEESNNKENENEEIEKDNENENDIENEEEEEDSKIEEKTKELIEKFDVKIKEFAEYITDEKLNEIENKIIKKIEEDLNEMSFNSNNNKKKDCFIRPALLFKNDNSIYKGSWNSNGKKEGFGIFIDNIGNKYIGEWKDDKLNGKGRLLSINGDYYEGYFNDGIIEGEDGIFYSKKMDINI